MERDQNSSHTDRLPLHRRLAAWILGKVDGNDPIEYAPEHWDRESRVIVISPEGPRAPSDLGGMTPEEYQNSLEDMFKD